MPDTDYPIMPDFKFTSNGIEKLLKGLNAYKAPGPDNLSPRLLKELSSKIASLLQLVNQKSLDTSCVPEDWRKANVTPVYIKGPEYLAENYRPL
jgi:predicted DNA-binding transcriptional regulator YafY